jgi:hypothetical protein
MSRTLYALLVGIDDYAPSVPPLSGCVNDITAFGDWLTARTAGEFQLRVRALQDKEARREAIIAGFREHLAQAGPNDVALFYYSGHGSQEPCPEKFWPIEPDHLDETLVCWDSREPGGWDLADKELAYLIAHVANRGAHVVVILDSCHSGSATRGAQPQTAVRWIPADIRPRPPESFIFALSDLAQRSVGAMPNPSGWQLLPEGRHVLLAACQDSETAKEYYADGKSWGAFSYFLRTTLEGTRGVLTYRDLFKQAQSRVRASIPAQSPQLEATQSTDVDRAFLGGALAACPPYFTVSHAGNDWVLDAGSIHGLPTPSGDDTVVLALFPSDVSPDDMRQSAKALGQARVTSVMPQASRVTLIGLEEADTSRTFKAVVVGLPLPPLGVRLEGEAEGLALVRTALEQSANGTRSLYVREAESAPQLWLVACNGQYTLTRPDDERPLVARITGFSAENARAAVQRLEHIARWMKTVDLQNPDSHLPTDAVAMSILKDGAEQDLHQLVFEYRYQNGKWEKPTYGVSLRNQSAQTLYCTVLGLWESFAIEPVFSQQPVVKLEPGQEFSRQLTASVPDDVWQQGITDRQDILKLIACTAEFDARLLGQGKLDAARDVTRTTRGLGPRNTLSRLMNRVQTREADDQSADETIVDWITSQVAMTIRRPLDTQPVPRAGQTLSLGAGVTLAGHPSLVARARIGAVPPVSRDLGTPGLPPLLRQVSNDNQPFYFRTMRGIGLSENTLELCDVQDHTVVTPDNPLSLTINSPLSSGEQVMAFGFDGEFFLPLGFSRRVGDKTQIDLQRLPAPCGTRDLRSTIRILFQKFVAQPLGRDYPYPLLASATIGPDGTVEYEKDRDKVKQQVAQARQITLFVHGITGDTRGMAASARKYCGSDLILTFDYESVNTTIEETARSLKARLESVGLGAGHGKTLRLVVHSLGGLVARWFIEREGGSEIVQRLVILGTPSAGSPWSTVQQWATLGIGLALNGLTTVAWPVKVLGALISAFEKIDVTLDQFQPGSEFLKTLAASADPHVHYTLIAGNTSIIPDALEPTPGKADARLERLLKKLGYGAASLVFFRRPNDIAVSVESVRAVSADRTPPPQVVEVACDHTMFFESLVGLEALTQALQ